MKPIAAEYLNFMSSMGRDLLSKISLWIRTKTTSWARKSPKFSKSDDESSISETSMLIKGRSTVGSRMPHPVYGGFEQPDGGGFLWSTFS
jgi:hypothetical protein